jgi:hypothetical protein
MHRSGTSAATRLINMLGPAMCRPDDVLQGAWNPSGHYESRTLVRLDNQLLTQMGRTWWYPPPGGEEYLEVADRITTGKAKAGRVFRRVHPKRPWVWKDPRACLLVPFWRAALGDGVVAVLVVRNPLEVADSLQRRHDVPVRFGVALWERYNRLVLAHASGMPVLVSRYEDLVSDPSGWCERMAGFLSQAGFQVKAAPLQAEADEFVDPGKRHSAHTRSEVAAEAPGALATLDALESLVGAHPSFEPEDLAPEAPWVQEELAQVGPDQRLAWHAPPWAAPAADAAAEPSRARRSRRTLRRLRRLSQRLPVARWLR